MRERVESWLRDHGLEARYRPLDGLNEANLARAVREECGGVLVLSIRDPLPHGGSLADLLGEVQCPVLLVR